MKKALFIFAAAALAACSQNRQAAQAPDAASYRSTFSRPVTEVLDELAQRFGKTIDYGKMPDTLMLDNAGFRLKPWSLEESLKNVLLPVGYTYSYDSAKQAYTVSRFRRHQISQDEGRLMMSYLSNLYSNRASWEARRDTLRRDIRRTLHLDRLPEHFDGAVYLSDKREYNGYYVQNLGLEILPGVYCTGSVYHPSVFSERSLPAIINPHGHYAAGRYDEAVQTRCIMQARMGCIAIAFDTFGKGMQPMFPDEWHNSILAQPVHALCALRLVDYTLSLPEVDPERIGVTGSSGGATQAMFLTALDDRISVSAPVVMMSSYFLGGCECESGAGVHLICGGTNNVEIGSMFAPKPMLIVSDGGDWTVNTPEVEFPFVKRIYGFYGAEGNVCNVHLPDEGHDYGPSKRQAVYDFFARQWGLDVSALRGADGRLDESGCVIEDYDLLKVWGADGSLMPADAVTDPVVLAGMLGF